MKLYIGNLSYGTTEDDIRELLAQYGTAESIELIKDRHTGQSKGFGFVEMNNSEADAAIKGLNETFFKGRKIKINQAQPKAKGARSRRRY